ncbi:hypothetical protein PG990_012002 [Apiospora arundinis]
MDRHAQTKDEPFTIRRWISYLVRGSRKENGCKSLEGQHPVEVEIVSLSSSWELVPRDSDFPTEHDASISATFDSNSVENLISKDIVEMLLGHKIGDPSKKFDIVIVVFNIIGQKQRFATSHRVVDVPCFENILFSRCRLTVDASKPSPLELHILNRDAFAERCTCCFEPVCRLGGLNCDTRRCSSTVDNMRVAEPDHIEDGEEKLLSGLISEGPGPSSLQRRTEATSISGGLSLGHAGNGHTNDRGIEELDKSRERHVQPEAAHERDNQRSPHPQTLFTHNMRYTSFDLPHTAPADSTSEYLEVSSNSTRSLQRTSSTSVDMNEAKPQPERQKSRGCQDCRRNLQEQVQGQHEIDPQPHDVLTPTHAPISSKIQDASATVGRPPSSANACDCLRKDHVGGEVDFADKEEFPPVPYPDEYWTYDKKAGNYYHSELGPDGKETREWYPQRLLDAHKEELKARPSMRERTSLSGRVGSWLANLAAKLTFR